MQLILKKTILYKKDKDGKGVLFSLGDDSDKILQVNGLVNQIAEALYLGVELSKIKAKVLDEYDVTEAQLDKDLEGLSVRLTELDFLEK